MDQLFSFRYEHTEKSLLESDSLVKWKKNNGAYNFDQLPNTAIITLNKSSLSRINRFVSKKLRGIQGDNYLLSTKTIFVSGFGNGAPALVGVMEELHALGVEKFVFVGWAGSINKKYKSGELFLVENSYSTTGCAQLYSRKSNFEPKENDWSLYIKSKLSLPVTTCWSTDAPFRETNSLVNFFREKGASHVDMECAAIYAFADHYKLNALCFLVTADFLSANEWVPPQNTKQLSSNVKNLVASLINLLND